MKSDPRFFVRWWLGLTVVALLAVAALNVLVDPIGAFPGLHLRRFESLRYLEYDRVAKAEMARRGDWEVVVLGSSRAKAGFPADHPFFLTHRSCNLSLDGARLPELAMALDFARRKNPLKHVILGLDWFMFTQGASSILDFRESHFSPEFAPLDFYSKQALGEATTTRSWRALRRKIRGFQPSPQESHGFYDHHLDARTCQRELFDRVLHQTSGYSFPTLDPGMFEVFRQIVRACRDAQIDLQAALLPVHALDLEVLHAGGCWPQFEQLKTQLVDILAEEGVAEQFGLWDFTGYSGPPAEAIPPAGDATRRMKYYFENSHFTPACGWLMMDTMLGDGAANGFGVRLTRANLQAHLASILADRAAYARTNAAELRWAQQVVAEVTRRPQAAGESETHE